MTSCILCGRNLIDTSPWSRVLVVLRVRQGNCTRSVEHKYAYMIFYWDRILNFILPYAQTYYHKALFQVLIEHTSWLHKRNVCVHWSKKSSPNHLRQLGSPYEQGKELTVVGDEVLLGQYAPCARKQLMKPRVVGGTRSMVIARRRAM